MLRLAAENGGNPDDPNKGNPLDFVLWQPSAPGEPAWESLWGRGRPGWHIECSALAMRELGATIDLHGGGTDLIFPHHECEAAQSEAATGETFVRHWMHVGLVRLGGTKMSKSLGNLVFVSDLLKDWEPAVIRLAIIAQHYRSGWDWDDEMLTAAASRLEVWRAAGAGGSSGDRAGSGLGSGAQRSRRRPGCAGSHRRHRLGGGAGPGCGGRGGAARRASLSAVAGGNPALDRLWAGWRSLFVTKVADDGPGPDCVFCAILASGLPDEDTHILWRHPNGLVIAILNLYPYTSGHLMVMPTRHIGDLEELTDEESGTVWAAMTDAVRALKATYRPEALNIGANLGAPRAPACPATSTSTWCPVGVATPTS